MSDETASRLSSKLLQGWCMMDKGCDVCYTPLMRDKEKNDYCCGCQVYVHQRPKPVVEEAKIQVQESIGKTKASGSLTTLNKIEECIQMWTNVLLTTGDLDEAMKITEIIEKLSNSFKAMN